MSQLPMPHAPFHLRAALLLALSTSLAACAAGPPAGDEAQSHASAIAVTPNDPHFNLQSWHLNAIRVPDAWSLTTGSSNVLVAVADSGRMSHPDLDAKWTGGYDFFAADNDPSDDGTYHHGIHTAGIAAAAGNNGIGVAGICWNCPIMPVRIAQAGGFVSGAPPGLDPDPTAVLARAIRYAAGLVVADDGGIGHNIQAPQRADVVNISLGNYHGITCEPALQSAINDAFNAGTVIVAAAGNGSDDGDWDASHYLWATCQNVVVVTAVDANGNAEAYANLGSGVTIAAPGGSAVGGQDGYGELIDCTDPEEVRGTGTHGVVSTWSTAQGTACYRHWAGTSMAAPHVTGVVALMRSKNKRVSATNIVQILKQTAKPIACPTSQCGAGLVDAFAAVQATPPGIIMTGSCTDRGGVCTAQRFCTGTGHPISAPGCTSPQICCLDP